MLSIVIPVYNEGENIKNVVCEIKEKIKTPNNVYVVYDDEKDNTIPAVKKLISNNTKIHLLKNKYRSGFINAIRTGFENSESEAILIVMADSSDDLTNVDEMFRLINSGYDLVCGSRYMKGGKQIGGSWFKKLLSRAAGVSLHYLTGVPTHDVTNSFKMYRKKYLNEIMIESIGGFELGLELIVKAFVFGYKIIEVPCIWRDTGEKKSRFKLWAWLPKYLHWYWFAILNGNNNNLKRKA
ncbi:glycosyl transferase family 2 [candidate division WOR-1 bacterium RIFOXYC2_FULL_37_10]|uniref:Glycosyl transferase family 2 n=1 Tax=candidate division WOR-1 bacterium RIFOXYB2_FULL_37_13 TaxID=1802579 RepID=A0A1F4SQF3_UNCSA|nr:MAG: glycosyl transferase family 2 [candidate division WOR-1 bacterium RIFOXYB2_FULL_37_13]OGC33387.1 MAG: glycosyl transferase family 2 [candidate division WOR-1 bacterium RIFOXYC2_FULL_37_10]